MLDDGLDLLVSVEPLPNAKVVLASLDHQLRETLLEVQDARDDPRNVLGVEGERLLQLLKDADEVEDKPCRLRPVIRILIRPVDPSDALKQNVVTHRLIEIHRIQ